MICKNCNTYNPDGQKFCSNCGMPLSIPEEVPEIPKEVQQPVQRDINPNILCIASLGILIFNGVLERIVDAFTHTSILYRVLSTINEMAPLVAIALVIIVRVKYPDNVFGKVLMWLYIVLFVALVVLLFSTIAACFYGLSNCQG